MVRYSEELIEEIRNNNDIVDVISQYVTLKRSGRNFFGLCPFHKEKTPSFSVSVDKQIFHCFGCGAGGNVIHFISKIENLDFKDSLEILANRAGMQLPTLDNQTDSKLQELKNKVYEINKIAAEFYHKTLYEPQAKIAQEYVKKRKLDNKTLKNFTIGYSEGNGKLYKHLKQQGFTDEEILKSDLVNYKNNNFIDRFNRRLIFPIQDIRNRIIAFGGRILDNSLPKYINSPENIVYSKGRNLYGLNIAKASDSKKIIIVEGYMDAISLHQRGITNVVASLGTALTEAQGRLLRKYAEQVIIAYDSDSAGQAATLRGLEILINLGCDVRILQMEGAKDPDEFVIKYGVGRFNILVEKSISLIEFKIKVLKQNLNIENTQDKIKFLNEIAKLLVKVDNKIEQEVYIDKIAKEYRISKEAVYAEINKLAYGRNQGAKLLESTNKKIVIKKNKDVSDIIIKRENMIILLLLNEPRKAYKSLENIVSIENIKRETNKRIIKKFYEEFNKENYNTNNILDWFAKDEEAISILTAIMAEEYEVTNYQKMLDNIIKIYETEKLINRKNEILETIKNNQDKNKINNLEQELQGIIIKLAQSK